MLGETADQADALDDFQEDLRGLRARAGDPSFRRMAAKSGAVSHATLHLTLTGYRLQPWETVREFVRACDGDEDAWHARWRETSEALSGEPEEEPRGDHDEADVPADEGPAPRRARWRRKRVLLPLALVVVAALAATVVALVRGGGHPAAARRTGPRPMVYKNDASTFIKDVTYPDGTVVKPDTEFVKIWELRNSGGVEWRDRYLQRIDLPIRRDDCTTPVRVPVNHTFPRETVQITVPVRTPEKAPVNCKVRWKMVDGSGRVLMPGYRPLYFDVRVRQ